MEVGPSLCSHCCTPTSAFQGEGQNSVTLGCGHTVCFSCLQRQWLTSGWNDSESINCVSCSYEDVLSSAVLPSATPVDKGSLSSSCVATHRNSAALEGTVVAGEQTPRYDNRMPMRDCDNKVCLVSPSDHRSVQSERVSNVGKQNIQLTSAVHQPMDRLSPYGLQECKSVCKAESEAQVQNRNNTGTVCGDSLPYKKVQSEPTDQPNPQGLIHQQNNVCLPGKPEPAQKFFKTIFENSDEGEGQTSSRISNLGRDEFLHHPQFSSFSPSQWNISTEVNESLYQTCLEPCDKGTMNDEGCTSSLNMVHNTSGSVPQEQIQNASYRHDSFVHSMTPNCQSKDPLNPNQEGVFSKTWSLYEHIFGTYTPHHQFQESAYAMEAPQYPLNSTSYDPRRSETMETMGILLNSLLDRFLLHLSQVKSVDRKNWPESHSLYFDQSASQIENLVSRATILSQQYRPIHDVIDCGLQLQMMDVLYLTLSNLIFAHQAFQKMCSFSHMALNEQLTFYPDVLTNTMQTLTRQSIMAATLACNVCEDIYQQYQLKVQKDNGEFSVGNFEACNLTQENQMNLINEIREGGETLKQDAPRDATMRVISPSNKSEPSTESEEHLAKRDHSNLDVVIDKCLSLLTKRRKSPEGSTCTKGDINHVLSQKPDTNRLHQPEALYALCHKKAQNGCLGGKIQDHLNTEKYRELPNEVPASCGTDPLNCKVICPRVDDIINFDQGSSLKLSAESSQQINQAERHFERLTSPILGSAPGKPDGGAGKETFNRCRSGTKRHGPMDGHTTENCSPAKRKVESTQADTGLQGPPNEVDLAEIFNLKPRRRKELFPASSRKDESGKSVSNKHDKTLSADHDRKCAAEKHTEESKRSIDSTKHTRQTGDNGNEKCGKSKTVHVKRSTSADKGAVSREIDKQDKTLRADLDRKCAAQKHVEESRGNTEGTKHTWQADDSGGEKYSMSKTVCVKRSTSADNSATTGENAKHGKSKTPAQSDFSRNKSSQNVDSSGVSVKRSTSADNGAATGGNLKHDKSKKSTGPNSNCYEYVEKVNSGRPTAGGKRSTGADNGAASGENMKCNNKTSAESNCTSHKRAEKVGSGTKVNKTTDERQSRKQIKDAIGKIRVGTEKDSVIRKDASIHGKLGIARDTSGSSLIITRSRSGSKEKKKEGKSSGHEVTNMSSTKSKYHSRCTNHVGSSPQKQPKLSHDANTGRNSGRHNESGCRSSNKSSDKSLSHERKSWSTDVKDMAKVTAPVVSQGQQNVSTDGKAYKTMKQQVSKVKNVKGEIRSRNILSTSKSTSKSVLQAVQEKTGIQSDGSSAKRTTHAAKTGSERKGTDLTKSRSVTSESKLVHRSDNSARNVNPVKAGRRENSSERKPVTEIKSHKVSAVNPSVYDFSEDSDSFKNKLLSVGRKALSVGGSRIVKKFLKKEKKKKMVDPSDCKYRSISSDSSDQGNDESDDDDDSSFGDFRESPAENLFLDGETDLPSLSYTGRHIPFVSSDGHKKIPKRCRRLDTDTLLQIRHIFGVEFDLGKYGVPYQSVTKPPVNKVGPFKQRQEEAMQPKPSNQITTFRVSSEKRANENTGSTGINVEPDLNNNDISGSGGSRHDTTEHGRGGSKLCEHIDGHVTKPSGLSIPVVTCNGHQFGKKDKNNRQNGNKDKNTKEPSATGASEEKLFYNRSKQLHSVAKTRENDNIRLMKKMTSGECLTNSVSPVTIDHNANDSNVDNSCQDKPEDTQTHSTTSCHSETDKLGDSDSFISVDIYGGEESTDLYYSSSSSSVLSSGSEFFVSDNSETVTAHSDFYISDGSVTDSKSGGKRKKRRKRRGVHSSSSDEIIPVRKERGLRQVEKCFAILNKLYNNVHGEPFCHEVKSKDMPDYYKIVKRGMCFDIIAYKLRNYIYHSVKDYLADMRLIFYNCKLYNKPGTQTYRSGEKIEKWFNRLFQKAFPECPL